MRRTEGRRVVRWEALARLPAKPPPMEASLRCAHLLELLAPSRLVETACGSTLGWSLYAAQHGEVEYHVTDSLSPSLAIEALEGRAAPARAVQGDPCALDVVEAWADVALCCRALHRLSDPESTIRELERVVRPGGRVLVVDRVAPEDALAAIVDNDAWAGLDPQHVRSLGLGELCRLLGLGSLQVEKVELFEELVATPGGEARLQRTALLLARRSGPAS